MKKLLSFLALAASIASASAATLNPIQLLSPSGSSAGQAIVSTGPSTAPAWGAVPTTALGSQAANTVLANATGSAAAPTAFAMPSCSAANQALRWTSGSGFTCTSTMGATGSGLNQFAATTSAQLAGVISDETGSGSLVFGTSPALTTPAISGGTINSATIGATTPSTGSFTTVVSSGAANFNSLTAGASSITGLLTPSGGIAGVTSGTASAAGQIGQLIESTVASGSAVSLVSGTAKDVTSISITAGDWDVWGTVCTFTGGTTTVSSVAGSINTTSATLPPPPNSGMYFNMTAPFTTGQGACFSLGQGVKNVSVTTTLFLVAYSVFGTSTQGAYGYIAARRRH